MRGNRRPLLGRAHSAPEHQQLAWRRFACWRQWRVLSTCGAL